MLLRVYSNRFFRNHTGKVIPRVLPSYWKLSRFRPNPTWCILRRGLKTIWGNFQTAVSDITEYLINTKLDNYNLAYYLFFKMTK